MKPTTTLHPEPNPGRPRSPGRAGQKSQAVSVLGALADPTRLGLIRCLLQGERCVGDLTDAMGLRQPRVSHFPRSGRPQKQQIAQRPVGWIHPRQKDLVYRSDRLDGFLLPYDL